MGRPSTPSSCAIVVVAVLLGAGAAHAQRREIARTVTLDVIGPRRAGSVRAWLGGRARSIEHCRADVDALAVVSLAIGPDGALLDVSPREDPDADPAATACVVEAARAWRMPSRAGSVTTVSWSVRLLARRGVRCHCFGWVHGGDHGTSCSTSARACEAERRTTGRDSTPCRELGGLESCGDDAFIDGVRMEHP